MEFGWDMGDIYISEVEPESTWRRDHVVSFRDSGLPADEFCLACQLFFFFFFFLLRFFWFVGVVTFCLSNLLVHNRIHNRKGQIDYPVSSGWTDCGKPGDPS